MFKGNIFLAVIASLCFLGSFLWSLTLFLGRYLDHDPNTVWDIMTPLFVGIPAGVVIQGINMALLVRGARGYRR
jgi:hypothetical protein